MIGKSGEAPLVLTPKDYYLSTQKRKDMYDHIKKLAGKFSTLFVGYSLEDYNFNNIFHELQDTLGKYLAQSYTVMPVSAPKARHMEKVYPLRGITLIDDKFDTFMIKLADSAGSLINQAASTTVEELNRPNVLTRLGAYADALPTQITGSLAKSAASSPGST